MYLYYYGCVLGIFFLSRYIRAVNGLRDYTYCIKDSFSFFYFMFLSSVCSWQSAILYFILSLFLLLLSVHLLKMQYQKKLWGIISINFVTIIALVKEGSIWWCEEWSIVRRGFWQCRTRVTGKIFFCTLLEVNRYMIFLIHGNIFTCMTSN